MKLTKKFIKNNKLRRNKSKKQIKKRKQSKNNKLRRNKSKKLRNKSNNGGKAIPPSDYPDTVRRSRDDDGILLQQLPLQPLQQPQQIQFAANDSIIVNLPEDIVVARLENVPLAARTPENLDDFNHKRANFLLYTNHANMARELGSILYSLNDVIRLESRVRNLRNDVYNRYGRDILEAWDPDPDPNEGQGPHIVIEQESDSDSDSDDDPNAGVWIE
jgi:hypothetical protein